MLIDEVTEFLGYNQSSDALRAIRKHVKPLEIKNKRIMRKKKYYRRSEIKKFYIRREIKKRIMKGTF